METWYSNLLGGGQDDVFTTTAHRSDLCRLNFLIVSAANSTLLAVISVCPVPFGFGSLSRIMFGLNGYTPVARNPDSMLLMVMLLHHTSETNDENWNFVITLLGCANKYL